MSSNIAGTNFSIQTENAPRRSILPLILFALAAPVLVLIAVDPRAFSSATVIAYIYLPAIFVVAMVAFLISVFETGDVTSVTIDKPTRTVTVVRSGMLAKSAISLPFAEVITARIETRYDDDGYKTLLPVLVLATREIIPLPAGTSESDVAAMRALLGAS